MTSKEICRVGPLNRTPCRSRILARDKFGTSHKHRILYQACLCWSRLEKGCRSRPLPPGQPAEAQNITDIVLQNFYNVARRNNDAFIDNLVAQAIAYVPFFPAGALVRCSRRYSTQPQVTASHADAGCRCLTSRAVVLILEREWRGLDRTKSNSLRTLQRRGRERTPRGWVPPHLHLPTRVHLPRGASEGTEFQLGEP
jgi:hypothetical protein